ncbi:hypothetical protein IWZ03DRAFT_247379 [Phyllosticta citriasiana]|uniref:Secreted protein n=1 Tax=Phyllosticta citriasiana TaxID=595635 RepID=A0ABR1KL44_9PEZI
MAPTHLTARTHPPCMRRACALLCSFSALCRSLPPSLTSRSMLQVVCYNWRSPPMTRTLVKWRRERGYKGGRWWSRTNGRDGKRRALFCLEQQSRASVVVVVVDFIFHVSLVS